MAEDLDRVTFGCDPEFFLFDAETDEFVPACEITEARKGSTLPVLNHRGTNIGSYLADNVSLEINLAKPQNSTANMFDMMSAVRSAALKDVSTKYGRTLIIKPKAAIKLPKKHLTHKDALAFGCDPDMDAYADAERTPPDPKNLAGWRFAGGHIHIGCKPWPDDMPKHVYIRFLDLFMRYQTLQDEQGHRKQYYGLPGLWRDKPYGVEWRSPSNWWTFDFDNKRRDYIYTLFSGARAALYEPNRETLIDIYRAMDWQVFREALMKEENALPAIQLSVPQNVAHMLDSLYMP